MISSGTVVNWARVSLRVPALRLGKVLEQDVRLAVEHPMALLNDSETDSLGKMALPGAGRNSHILRSFGAPSPFTIPGIHS
jgi:hypothetical protein